MTKPTFYLLYFFLSGTNAEIIHAKNGKDVIELFRENDDLDFALMDL